MDMLRDDTEGARLQAAYLIYHMVKNGASSLFISLEYEGKNYVVSILEKGDNIESHFDKFWNLWPRHSRKNDKPKCKALWERNELDKMWLVIMPALERWKASKEWKGGEFIPAPLVWLRGERWENSPETIVVRETPMEQVPF